MKKVLFILLAIVMAYTGYAQCGSVFSITPIASAGNQKLRVSLNNVGTTPTSTTLPITREIKVKWGDGATGYLSIYNNNIHNYSTPGTYTVWQIVRTYDSASNITYCIDSVSHNVTVAYTPCAASASVSLNPLNNGQATVSVTSLGTSPYKRYTYYAVNPPNTYVYNSTSPTFTVTYPTSGYKTVYVYVTDSPSFSCTDTIVVNFTVINGCTGNHAQFSSSVSGLNATFYNTSTYLSGAVMTSKWYFGDGGTSTAYNGSHTYGSAGTYTACLVTSWRDSLTNNVICSDSICHNVTTTTPPNVISGYIFQDSSLTALHVDSPDYKVWLIQYDSATTTLTAVDSQVVHSNYFMYTPYQFLGKAAGTYRTKAKLLNGPTSGTGYVPTYHTASLMWNTATLINHTGGSSINKNINMQVGTITSGPGFIGGNVSAGANKGTASGIAGLTMLLLDGAGNMVTWATTDANGDYTFQNIPPAVYSVYPEEMGFTTTAISVTILNGQATLKNVNFLRSESHKTIAPGTTGIVNINDNKLGFAIFPNPAKDKATILWDAKANTTANVIVTDITGKKVYAATVYTGTNTELNLAGLQKGMYFVTVIAGENKYTEKLMLQ